MSQAGVKQQEAADNTQARKSGRYQIDEERARVASNQQSESRELAHAPSTEQREPTLTALQLLEINTLSGEELEWIEARKRKGTPSEPARGMTSAVFAKEGELDQSFSALRPYYREPTLERVQLQFEDRSLDPQHNPLALSSLTPPAKRRWPMPAPVSLGVGALALLGVGYLAAAHFESSSGSPMLEPPARMAKAPRVLPAAPEGAEETSNAATEAPDNVRSADAPPAAAVAIAVPWSIDPASEAASRNGASNLAPAAETALALTAEVQSTTGTPLPPGWNRRRLLALRARLQAAKLAAAQASESALQAQLPPQPSREQIQAGIESVRSALQQCTHGTHGTTTAHVTVTGSGRVAQANIEGAFAGTPQGSCMARALRTALFPRFAAPSLQVTYPFRF